MATVEVTIRVHDKSEKIAVVREDSINAPAAYSVGYQAGLAILAAAIAINGDCEDAIAGLLTGACDGSDNEVPWLRSLVTEIEARGIDSFIIGVTPKEKEAV